MVLTIRSCCAWELLDLEEKSRLARANVDELSFDGNSRHVFPNFLVNRVAMVLVLFVVFVAVVRKSARLTKLKLFRRVRKERLIQR
jgi:hypothetical protein